MPSHKEDPPDKFHILQADRDLEANWEVDLAKKLEDYLLKICSGEITGTQCDSATTSVNFAEAALLLQGSVQVYSRKVEYLYNLVLHALEFLTRNRQDVPEGTPDQPEQAGCRAVPDEENEQFWGLDDIPVEARNCLDASTSKDASFYHLVKPPANLIVFEGDCLDITGDEGELESYLLATTNLYQDFILLDSCDTITVNEFLNGDETRKGQNSASRCSSARKSFLSPTKRSGGTAIKSSLGKNLDANISQSPTANCGFDCKMVPDPPAYDNFEDGNHGFDMDDKYTEPENLEDSLDDEDDEDNDPWKPLNPHEPGKLKVKPFKKVKALRKNGVNSHKQISITSLFPLARMHGPVSPELTKIWEAQLNRSERHVESQSPSSYEKLRESLVGCHITSDAFDATENDNDDNDIGFSDSEQPDKMPESMFVDEDLPMPHHKFDNNEAFEHGDPCSQASLEDLCRSHLDALLANIAETEKQSELAARVASWKQKIESNLEEQDSHPPFDIHAYGERIIEKLSVEANDKSTITFSDVVSGQEKHDVARTFSALLQLVNNGDVDFDKIVGSGEPICYTAGNPFSVRLLSHDKRPKETHFRPSKNGVKSTLKKGYEGQKDKFEREMPPPSNSFSKHGSVMVSSKTNDKFSSKLGKIAGTCTPESKRRRKIINY